MVHKPRNLTLAAADMRRVEQACAALLSPLDHETTSEWTDAVMEATRSVVGADQAFFAIPKDSAEVHAVRLLGQGPFTAAAAQAYQDHFCKVDPGRDRALGYEIFTMDMIFDSSEYGTAEIVADWCIPFRLLDPIGMSFQSGRGSSAVLALYRDNLGDPRFGDRGTAFLRSLYPAFKAGVHTSHRLAQHRAAFARVIDDIHVGLALLDAGGHLLHQNRMLSRLLAGDPGSPQLSAAMGRMAAAIYAEPNEASPLACEVRTIRGRYRLHATRAGAGLAGTHAAVLVLVERSESLSDTALREDYKLTAREVQIARLLAQGESNAEIAERLTISAHTAERHTEHVLMKLGVRSRAKVGHKLRGE